jgi:small neutral amino acid transporter SnatA (MarC family)
MLFSLAALALAGLLGRNILENLEISVPVLAVTGGLILSWSRLELCWSNHCRRRV